MAVQQSIENIMDSALKNIKEMVDVNTIVGSPVKTDEGITIIPISKVSFGFVAGGNEYGKPGVKEDAIRANFGGGSGAGISINPVGFLIVSNGDVKMLNIGEAHSSLEKVIEILPGVIDKVKDAFDKKKTTVKEETITVE